MASLITNTTDLIGCALLLFVFKCLEIEASHVVWNLGVYRYLFIHDADQPMSGQQWHTGYLCLICHHQGWY